MRLFVGPGGVVEAARFEPQDNDAVMALAQWAGSPPVYLIDYEPDSNHFYGIRLHTNDGIVPVHDGDWVVYAGAGEWLAVAAGEFAERYVPV